MATQAAATQTDPTVVATTTDAPTDTTAVDEACRPRLPTRSKLRRAETLCGEYHARPSISSESNLSRPRSPEQVAAASVKVKVSTKITTEQSHKPNHVAGLTEEQLSKRDHLMVYQAVGMYEARRKEARRKRRSSCCLSRIFCSEASVSREESPINIPGRQPGGNQEEARRMPGGYREDAEKMPRRSREEAGRKQGGSKVEARWKQGGSKEEARRWRTPDLEKHDKKPDDAEGSMV